MRQGAGGEIRFRTTNEQKENKVVNLASHRDTELTKDEVMIKACGYPV